ncbi:MAG: hypothetical protein WKF37_03215 [Bryobacteraceae bacterium]
MGLGIHFCLLALRNPDGRTAIGGILFGYWLLWVLYPVMPPEASDYYGGFWRIE